MGSWANPTGPTRVLAYILSGHCSQCSQTNSEPPPNRGVKAAVRGVLDGELNPLDFRFFIGTRQWGGEAKDAPVVAALHKGEYQVQGYLAHKKLPPCRTLQ